MPLTLTIPDSIADAIRLPEDRLPTELLCEPAVALYSQGLLAFGEARELAGLVKYEFSQLLADRGATEHAGSGDRRGGGSAGPPARVSFSQSDDSCSCKWLAGRSIG